jgi:L-seryl-tRNA(Ser) seleniumtransferase
VPPLDALLARIRGRAGELATPNLRPVINATGVVIHTNLGRSPLSPQILDAVRQTALGYSTLEYNLHTGRRGSRHDLVAGLLAELTGGEAAMVVNNNAAAVLLALSQLAKNHEVIVSRGQLVEIGGSFRIPEVMALSGAVLKEVGATNKTHLRDYEGAIGPETRVILKVHASNFRMIGFTESPTTAELVEVAHRHQLVAMEDLGSGVVESWTIDRYTEPSVKDVVAAGVDVVTFSGDKLLGGPQAGVIAGGRTWIEEMKRNPLARALRVDKMTLAALEQVVRIYLEDRQAELPLWQMLWADIDQLKGRARRLAGRIRRRLPSLRVELAEDYSEVGGGSMPGTTLPTAVVMLEGDDFSVAALEHALRQVEMPVIGRIQENRLILDVRTILKGQEPILLDSIESALALVKNGR